MTAHTDNDLRVNGMHTIAMAASGNTISLLTDFGLRDAYVGCVKGVLLSINPHLNIVDISHEVPKFQVKYAALILAQAAKFFPKGTVHMAIVDPGVGMRRRMLIVETKNYFFVGPDNGVLSIAAIGDGVRHAFQIDKRRVVLEGSSGTFAARDIFAPIAARITCGAPPEDFGREITGFLELTPSVPRPSGRSVVGEVLIIDSFGNIVTNIDGPSLKGVKFNQRIPVKVGREDLRVPFVRTYGEVKRGEALALIGSGGLLEIAINQGSMSERLSSAKVGTRVAVGRRPR